MGVAVNESPKRTNFKAAGHKRLLQNKRSNVRQTLWTKHIQLWGRVEIPNSAIQSQDIRIVDGLSGYIKFKCRTQTLLKKIMLPLKVWVEYTGQDIPAQGNHTYISMALSRREWGYRSLVAVHLHDSY